MKRKIYVPNRRAAISGSGNRSGTTGSGQGKWWNPPKKSPVKGLDEITKELEKKAEPTKRKRAPWTKMKGLGLVGGGGKK